MNKIPSKEENPNGLHSRYKVLKSDGSPVDDNAEYFVLRLDYGGKDEKHIKACRVAAVAYAIAISDHLPQLSRDIKDRYGMESVKLAPFSLLEYVHDYEKIIQSILPEYEKSLSHTRHGSAYERIHHLLSQYRSIADTAIYQAKHFIEDVKTQFKAIEIITEGITGDGLNHGQKRVIANHVITTLRSMVDRIDSFQWEYTERIFDRYNFFRSQTPERNLMERYRDLKNERDSLKVEISRLQNGNNLKAAEDIPF